MPMSTGQTVEQIFGEAHARSAGTERQQYLDEACGSDAELRRRVERLLRAYGDAQSFLESPATDTIPTLEQTPRELPESQVGPYKLLQPIGEGGMGIVYLAEQTEPVRRRVAVKIIKPGMD